MVVGIAHAELALHAIERHNARVGHENAGFLSAARGFVPLVAPRLQLSERFVAWDELAAELPALHENLRLRARVERLPLLDASSASLPAHELLRASAVLAMLTHAYWYVETGPPAHIPEVLQRPWQQVRARLGRKQEVLSYIDLIVYNWQLRDARGPVALHNLDLLLPTVGNGEERVFYLTQLEILARAAPLVSLTAAAQAAVARGDQQALEPALQRIAACLIECTKALAHIDPRPWGRTHVDPVRWARTVAPFAVPIHQGDIGPSGTSSPIFNALDIFFGRKRFDSALGREIVQLRATYPRAWRVFLAALQRLPVHTFVDREGSPALREAFAHALECYAGERGFLGRHRRKVYGYLEIAFKVGRSLTIGGFSGPFAARTWDEVDDALTSARAERAMEARACNELQDAQHACHATVSSDKRRKWSEIAQHNSPEQGYWLVVDGSVYDVTRFLDRHPGGPAIVRAYAGIDATHGFARAHAQSRLVAHMQAVLRIGTVLDPIPQLAAAQAHAYRTLVAALQLVVEMQNALELNLSFTMRNRAAHVQDGTIRASAGVTRAYEQQRERERAIRFEREYVAPLAGQVLPRVHAALLALHLQLPAAPQLSEPDAISSAHSARELLSQLKRGLITTLEPFEQPPLSTSAKGKNIASGWLQCIAALTTRANCSSS